MSEAKKVTIGVVSAVLSIAVLFALILMIVGKGDEPAPHPQPIVAQQSKPIPPKPAPVQTQPALTERSLTPDSVRPEPSLKVAESGARRKGQQQGNQRLQNPEDTPGTAEYIAAHIDEDLAKIHAENDSPRTATVTERDGKAEVPGLTLALLEQTGEPTKYMGVLPIYQVTALVRNTSSQPLKWLKMTVLYRTADGSLIGTENQYAEVRNIEPGDTSTIKVMTREHLDTIDHYDLKFDAKGKNVDFTLEQAARSAPRPKAKPREDQPPAKPEGQRSTIAILEQTGGHTKFGGMIPSYEVNALVRNTSSVPLKMLSMTVIFRRADNSLIGTEARMADARTLEPGDTTTIKAMDNGENIDEIDHYDLKFTAGFPDEKNVDFTVEQSNRPPTRSRAPTRRSRP